MNQPNFEPTPIPTAEPLKKNTLLWVIGGTALFLCCCCIVSIPAIYWLWENGDALLGM
jgi:hypothetical protein